MVQDDSLEQGDVFEACPVFRPPDDICVELTAGVPSELTADFEWQTTDVVLLSQSCDMVKDREKLREILLCGLFFRSQLDPNEHIGQRKGLEDARKGNLPGFHVLAECTLKGFERERRIVDFRTVYSLPLSFIRKLTQRRKPRLRLLPPYREHLSQAFARYFMRVGLPLDLTAFTE